jgi:hypothetical protein
MTATHNGLPVIMSKQNTTATQKGFLVIMSKQNATARHENLRLPKYCHYKIKDLFETTVLLKCILTKNIRAYCVGKRPLNNSLSMSDHNNFVEINRPSNFYMLPTYL